MLQTVLFIKLLLVHYTSQDPVAVQAQCFQNVTLQCPYDELHRGDFLAIVWYKLINGTENGIAMRTKDQVDHFDFGRPIGINPDYSLEIPGAIPTDSGIYQCTVRADVGAKNSNLRVSLIVQECTTPPSTTQPTFCDVEVKDVPTMWSIMGYLAMGLLKVTLSLISILVIRIISSRKKW